MKFGKLMFVFGTVALAMASAASHYTVNVTETSMLAGKEIKPGTYRVEVDGNKATLKSGKNTVEAEVKVETAGGKYPSNSVRYSTEGGKYEMQEIHIGGTATKLILSSPASATTGGAGGHQSAAGR